MPTKFGHITWCEGYFPDSGKTKLTPIMSPKIIFILFNINIRYVLTAITSITSNVSNHVFNVTYVTKRELHYDNRVVVDKN